MTGITVAELFVNLGIKGGTKAKQEAGIVDKGLKEIRESGLAAKAMIIGVVYAMERMMQGAAQKGVMLEQFANSTNLSTKELQKWQYAARMSGSSAEDAAGSIKGLQQNINAMLFQGKPIEGMSRLAEVVGFDPKRIQDTFYMMERLREFAKKMPGEMGNMSLRSFGLSDSFIAAMRNERFDPSKAQFVKSDSQIAALAKQKAAWEGLGMKVENAFSIFTAENGGELIKGLSAITDGVLKMAMAFGKLAKQIELMKWVNKIFEGWGLIFKEISEAIDSIRQGPADKTKVQYKKDGSVKTMFDPMNNEGSALDVRNWPDLLKNFMNMREDYLAKQDSGSKVEVNQTLNFNGQGVSAKEAAESHREAAKKASQTYRQMPQGQGG